MRRIIFTTLVVILIGNSGSNLIGQDVEPKKQWIEKHPLDFAFGNFSVGLPFSNIFINKFYPALTMGTEFYYRNKSHSQIYQTLKIGGYYTKYSTSSIFVNSETGYRYSFGFGLFADADIGVAYSQLFRPSAIYKLNSNGEYEHVRDWGKPSLVADFSLSLGYDFSKLLKSHVSIFLRYGNYCQLFYIPDIPGLFQNSFQAGVRFLINKNKSTNENK
jgi:hypothetical protein